jgi:7-carboxy-7-deazaguanine synthase
MWQAISRNKGTDKLKVVEIFDSIDGEGKRTGQPCTFIRLAGCNLRCSYCDTLYALFGEKEECVYEEMSVQDIMKRVNPLYKRVTLTGGEPLIHSGCDALVSSLLRSGIEVNIETNGAADIEKFRKSVPRSSKLFFTVDYKLYSSGVEDKMLWNNFVSLEQRDVVKFVVGSDEDFELMKSVIKKMSMVYEEMPIIYTGVVYGEYEPKRLVEKMLKEPLMKDAYYQIQLHKTIWDPDERGV